MLKDGSVSCKSAGWMPCTLAGLLATGIFVSYIWAICKKDVEPWLPFISDAGGQAPQSGIFALFLFFSAFIGLLTMLARHAALHQEVFKLQSSRLKLVNHIALGLGFICLSGMLVVAAYPVQSYGRLKVNQTYTNENEKQWRVVVLLPHSLGAMFCFAVGLVYAIFQSALSFCIRPAIAPGLWHGRHLHLFATRIAICVFALVALIVMSTVKGNDGSDISGPAGKTKSPVRPVAEWILAIMLMLLFLTLNPEMKAVGLEVSAKGPPCERARDCTSASTDQIYPSLT